MKAVVFIACFLAQAGLSCGAGLSPEEIRSNDDYEFALAENVRLGGLIKEMQSQADELLQTARSRKDALYIARQTNARNSGQTLRETSNKSLIAEAKKMRRHIADTVAAGRVAKNANPENAYDLPSCRARVEKIERQLADPIEGFDWGISNEEDEI